MCVIQIENVRERERVNDSEGERVRERKLHELTYIKTHKHTHT